MNRPIPEHRIEAIGRRPVRPSLLRDLHHYLLERAIDAVAREILWERRFGELWPA